MENVPPNPLRDAAAELLEWFWKSGVLRTRRYQLSPSGWLYRAYQIAEEIGSSPAEGAAPRKPAFALWGPSQVGKSTLLSTYLDHGADAYGNGSAIQWDRSCGVRFERENASTDVLTLNPYNFRSDASACITRFRLADTVPDVLHPVELKLASETQLAHSLCLGFVADWKADDRHRWTDESLREAVRKLGKAPNMPARPAFERAFGIASLLDLLVQSRFPENPFESLSERAGASLLDSALTNTSDAAATKFRGQLLWQDEPSINELFDELRGFRQKLQANMLHGKPLYCSYEVASLLMDMASYVTAVGGRDLAGRRVDPDDELQQKLLSISVRVTPSWVTLGIGDGEPLFDNVREFALLQALVWELVITVNSGRLDALGKRGQTLKSLLSALDVLDFPGVSNVGTGGADTLDQTAIQESGDHLLFSHLLKRGKTNAMVSATAKARTVDGFCLLLRTMSGISRPGIIADGIRTWWRFTTNTELSSNSARLAPINVCLTFFGELFNDVLSNPTTTIGSTFERFRSLGAAASPELSEFFPISFAKYESITNRQMQPPSAAEIEDAVNRMMQDNQVAATLSDEAIKSAVFTGGIARLCTCLEKQAQALRTSQLLRQRLTNVVQQFDALLNEASPADGSEQAAREQLLSGWQSRIRSRIGLPAGFKPDECEELSAAIRNLLTVLAEDLESLPLNLVDSEKSPEDYVSTQLIRWRERLGGSISPAAASLSDVTEKVKILAYFTDDVDVKEASQWLRSNFGTIGERALARDARRYAAAYLTQRILRGKADPGKREPTREAISSAIARLVALAEAEVPNSSGGKETSPHYFSVVGPFLDRIEQLKKSPPGTRPEQPGDAALLEIGVRWSNVKPAGSGASEVGL